MNLDSLPSRPLELSELRELDDGGEFRTVLPAAVFDLDDADYTLVPVVVLVTDRQVVGVGFDVDDGWTQVHGEAAASAEDERQRQAQTANRALGDWAQKTQQPWAEPDGAGTLVDVFD
jgi:hypothetical protein